MAMALPGGPKGTWKMTITLSNMTAIKTSYHGPTNTRGSRIIADAGMKRRVSVSYDHRLNSDGNHMAAAKALCEKMGWGGDMRGGGHERGQYFVFCNR
jgi:hypothetical protein